MWLPAVVFFSVWLLTEPQKCSDGRSPVSNCTQVGLNFYCHDKSICENVDGDPMCCTQQYSSSCSDTLSSGCLSFRDFGECRNPAIAQFCKLTCNLCENTCKDIYTDCEIYQKSNLCDTLVGYVNCTHTCGYCNGTRQPPVLNPLPGCQDQPVFDCKRILYSNRCSDAFYKFQACRSTCEGCRNKPSLVNPAYSVQTATNQVENLQGERFDI
ncbi:hypothetical protein QR680_000434 [Steinernema hermaphroditum]|uniref:ShKT domain-containing protein n=1 Tax=Steinernema hermaphroditum TaxID=289476 RepID=A0AA39GVC5_9BILA|nr:hypothetical protein QR680_000434 [Steinernema hermaphroditum]